jgi:hypothetical protein
VFDQTQEILKGEVEVFACPRQFGARAGDIGGMKPMVGF